jgi:hypothetical protein
LVHERLAAKTGHDHVGGEQKVHPIHVGQSQIDERDRQVYPGRDIDCGATRLRHVGLESAESQDITRRPQQCRIVVDDENVEAIR